MIHKNEKIDNLIHQNMEIKIQETREINSLKKIYDTIRKYMEIPCNYDKIISNPDIRMYFLTEAIETAFKHPEIDSDVRNTIFQMYEQVYNYLCKDSSLEEIEIPDTIIEKIFERKYIPNEKELSLFITLLKENRRIYELEIKDKYFSQTLKQGFHNGIIKDLKIEEQNLPHLLGLTNDGSLYEFYRKIKLEEEKTNILNFLGVTSLDDQNLDFEKFNKMFKDKFGLDYNEENCIKIISWRYDAKQEYLDKRDIKVTEEEREILNRTNGYALKSETLEFYCNPRTIHLLIEENNKVKQYIYEYIRKVTNDTSVVTDIDKYIKETKFKYAENKEFRFAFVKQFGYAYPLINYYETISKNISFYNFSLFKNLNSIIVDYDATSKKIESDVFLASYSQDKMENLKEKITRLIQEKDNRYELAISGKSNDKTLNQDYIIGVKSLSSFPEDTRYYFNYSFLLDTKQKQDDSLIKENTPKPHNITLIGFKASDEEKKRLEDLEHIKRPKVKHFLNCETNITSNYHLYQTDFTRYGIEYPIELIEERSNLPYNYRTKIIKMEKPLDRLSRYIIDYETNKESDDIRFIERLKRDIFATIQEYEQLTFMKLRIMEYRLETRNINQEELYYYRQEYEKEISESTQMLEILSRYKNYVEGIIDKEQIPTRPKRK